MKMRNKTANRQTGPKGGRFFLVLFVFFATHFAQAADFLIVPGQRIGAAVLGMTRPQMAEALGKPEATVLLEGGVLREDWLSKAIAPKLYVEKGLFFKHDFVTVYFRDGRALQVEVSSAAFKSKEGLGTATAVSKFWERYPGYTRISTLAFRNPDPSGCPAPKHSVPYEDAMSKGIAWRYGAWGGLAPDPDPGRLEIVIMHRRGEPVFVDPDGGGRLVWKIPPHQLMENYPRK
jgi:hypothetical protein